MEIEAVLVGRAGTARAAVLETALELRERAEMPADVEIRVHHVALQQVPVGVAIRIAEIGVVEQLVPLAQVASEREIRVEGRNERDVLDRIPELGAARGIPEEAIVLLVARRRDLGPRAVRRRCRLCDGTRGRQAEPQAQEATGGSAASPRDHALQKASRSALT